MRVNNLSSLAFILLNIIPGNVAIAQAQEEVQELVVEKVFQYGESCTQLAQLSRVELTGVTHQAYSEQFFDFCKTDNVYRCEDFNALLAGTGTLEDNGQSSCRYLPR